MNTQSGSDRAARLLVVEDEEHLAAGLKLNLELDGFLVDIAVDGKQAGEHLRRDVTYAAIILDVMLPDLDGFELCRRLRDTGVYTPVIMLTARSSSDDRVRGLEAGADDYLVKPFDLSELLARIRSLIRRQEWENDDQGTKPLETLTLGEARVDFGTHEVFVRGEPRSLTRLELDLLRYFASHPGKVLSREELLENVWHLRNYPMTRTVDNFVLRLRTCFEDDPSRPSIFVSVRGAGYRYCPPEE
ncbi:MAG: response regulator transcription factor [Planctomycetota bacterium]